MSVLKYLYILAKKIEDLKNGEVDLNGRGVFRYKGKPVDIVDGVMKVRSGD